MQMQPPETPIILTKPAAKPLTALPMQIGLEPPIMDETWTMDDMDLPDTKPD